MAVQHHQCRRRHIQSMTTMHDDLFHPDLGGLYVTISARSFSMSGSKLVAPITKSRSELVPPIT